MTRRLRGSLTTKTACCASYGAGEVFITVSSAIRVISYADLERFLTQIDFTADRSSARALLFSYPAPDMLIVCNYSGPTCSGHIYGGPLHVVFIAIETPNKVCDCTNFGLRKVMAVQHVVVE